MSDKDGAYREELAAAHARIASLEGELASRAGESEVFDKKILELEKKRADQMKAIEPKNLRRLAVLIPLVTTIIFGIPALAAAFTDPKLEQAVSEPVVSQ